MLFFVLSLFYQLNKPMMKHTKGNWKQRKMFENPILVNLPEQAEFYSNTIDIVNGTGRIIASVDYQTNVKNQGWGKNDTIELWEANAKLIAAAPELLEVLMEIVDLKYLSEYSDQDGLTERAEQAIKKVTE